MGDEMPTPTPDEIVERALRECAPDEPTHGVDLADIYRAIVAETRKADAGMLRAEAERVKHTSHADGLGMDWQVLESRLLEIATAIEREGE